MSTVTKNRLRELIKQGKPTIGTRIINSWPGVVEVIGHTGMFDYVEFLGEYGPYTLHDFDNIARATELFDMSSMIKIDGPNRTYIAERALGAGIQNMLFADISTVEDAEEAVRAVRPVPKGIMGDKASRSRGYIAKVPLPKFSKSLEDAVVALMIEKGDAVKNLEEIMSVKGVDMVQFGPADYSMSVGLPGQTTHPQVKRAELKVIKTALSFGVAPRAELNRVDEAKKYIDLGVCHFSLGIDLFILHEWWREKGKSLRALLAK